MKNFEIGDLVKFGTATTRKEYAKIVSGVVCSESHFANSIMAGGFLVLVYVKSISFESETIRELSDHIFIIPKKTLNLNCDVSPKVGRYFNKCYYSINGSNTYSEVVKKQQIDFMMNKLKEDYIVVMDLNKSRFLSSKPLNVFHIVEEKFVNCCSESNYLITEFT